MIIGTTKVPFYHLKDYMLCFLPMGYSFMIELTLRIQSVSSSHEDFKKIKNEVLERLSKGRACMIEHKRGLGNDTN